MADDIENVAEPTDAPTGEPESSYDAIIGGEKAEAPEVTQPSDSPKSDSEAPGGEEPKGEAVDDPEVELVIGDKTFTGKQSYLSKVIESALALGEDGSKALEKLESLAELKKNYDKDYTTKTQTLAEQRKSIEGAFDGKVPAPEEMQALGKVYKAYFQDDTARQVIDRIVNGQPIDSAQTPQVDPNADPQIGALNQKISKLESMIEAQTRESRAREEQRNREQTARTWNTWKSAKEKAGSNITEEIEGTMTPIIQALDHQHPDWDDTKILDEALRRAQIIVNPDGEKKKIISQTLSEANKAKKGNPPKITPKAGDRSDAEKSYFDLVAQE